MTFIHAGQIIKAQGDTSLSKPMISPKALKKLAKEEVHIMFMLLFVKQNSLGEE